MKKDLSKKILILSLFSLFLIPIFTFSAEHYLVPCGNQGQESCNFNHIIVLIERIINYIVFKIYPLLFTMSAVWAGFLYVTSGGDQNKITKARNIFKTMIIGLLIMLFAWLAVYTIVTAFGLDGVETFLAP